MVDNAPPAGRRDNDAAVEEAKTEIVGAIGSAVSSTAVTIARPAQELYRYWRNFGNLASFMENVERIDVLDQNRSHWVVKAPAGQSVEWTARVTEEVEGQFISWASEPDADVANSGKVEFCEAGARGTVVTATLVYDPPAGAIGKLVAKLFQREPAIQARRDLRRFKQLMETGEIAVAARTIAMCDKERN